MAIAAPVIARKATPEATARLKARAAVKAITVADGIRAAHRPAAVQARGASANSNVVAFASAAFR